MIAFLASLDKRSCSVWFVALNSSKLARIRANSCRVSSLNIWLLAAKEYSSSRLSLSYKDSAFCSIP